MVTEKEICALESDIESPIEFTYYVSLVSFNQEEFLTFLCLSQLTFLKRTSHLFFKCSSICVYLLLFLDKTQTLRLWGFFFSKNTTERRMCPFHCNILVLPHLLVWSLLQGRAFLFLIYLFKHFFILVLTHIFSFYSIG